MLSDRMTVAVALLELHRPKLPILIGRTGEDSFTVSIRLYSRYRDAAIIRDAVEGWVITSTDSGVIGMVSHPDTPEQSSFLDAIEQVLLFNAKQFARLASDLIVHPAEW